MLSKARTVRLNDIEIIGTAPVGREQDFLTVRRPYGPDIDGGRADQLTLVAAIVVHQVDIKNPVSVGDKCELRAIGGLDRIQIKIDGVGKTDLRRTVCIHIIVLRLMFPVRDTDDLAAVGGESGVNIGSIGLGQRNPFPAGLIPSITFIVPPFTSEMAQALSSVG